MKVVVAAAGCLVLLGCGQGERAHVAAAEHADAQEIWNGDPAPGGEYSGVGALVNANGDVLCSGTLIGRSVVLTAAQCVRSNKRGGPATMFVTKQSRMARIVEALPHPLFEGEDGVNLAFDVALLRLDSSETRNWKDVARHELAEEDMPVEQIAEGAGFGETGVVRNSRDGNPSRGWDLDRTYGEFLVAQYIAGEGPSGVIPNGFIEVVPGNERDQMICPGDCGGPLLYRGQVAGVASFRFVADCGTAGPGYHVSTPRLNKWIVTHAQDLDAIAAAR